MNFAEAGGWISRSKRCARAHEVTKTIDSQHRPPHEHSNGNEIEQRMRRTMEWERKTPNIYNENRTRWNESVKLKSISRVCVGDVPIAIAMSQTQKYEKNSSMKFHNRCDFVSFRSHMRSSGMVWCKGMAIHNIGAECGWDAAVDSFVIYARILSHVQCMIYDEVTLWTFIRVELVSPLMHQGTTNESNWSSNW